MFLTIFLTVLFLVAGQYVNTTKSVWFPIANVPFASVFESNYRETPSIVNMAPIPASVIIPSPNVVNGFNPSIVNPAPLSAVAAPRVVPSGYNTPYVNTIPAVLSSPAEVTVPFTLIPGFQKANVNDATQLAGVNTAGINPYATAFIREASGIITSNAVLNDLYTLQKLPVAQRGNAYFNSLENTLEAYGVPNSVNMSSDLSQTIVSLANEVSPSLFLNAVLKASGEFLADEGILTTGNALSLAQSYSRSIQNALNAATAAGTPSPHINALVDGGASFLASLGVSLPNRAAAMMQRLKDNLTASKQ